MISSFEKRIKPGYLFSWLPKPALAPLILIVPVFAGVVLADGLRSKLFIGAGFAYIIYWLYIIFTQYESWLVRKSMAEGKKLFSLPTFASKDDRIYADAFGWKTVGQVNVGNDQVNEYFIHHDGAISIAFVWDGIHNRYFDHGEFKAEHERRKSLLNRLSTDYGFVIEHHLLRRKDTRLVDAYEREGQRMFKGKQPPKIITDIRKGIADTARKFGRSNKVMTVLSVDANSDTGGLLSYLKPAMGKRNELFEERASWLFKELRGISSYYPGLKLLDRAQYAMLIQAIHNPYRSDYQSVDWCLPLNEQLFHKKPVWNDEIEGLECDGVIYKVCVLQGYPPLSYPWVFKFVASKVDMHVSQVLKPKHVQKALDKSKSMEDVEKAAISKRKSSESLLARFADIMGFRQYVATNGLSILDNVYIVTFTCKAQDKFFLEEQVRRFAEEVAKSDGNLIGGYARTDKDLQMDFFRVRLPGMGRNSLFFREDHSSTVAAMMPFTTFPIGSTKPESLRIDITGNLVGFEPSTCSVAHEMVVARTGGGKDSQYGIKIAETYPRIRYDIIELGNTYQGIIEAIGGRYCTARDQVINPLSSYAEFDSTVNVARKLGTGTNSSALEDHTLASQMTILTPVFKGMDGKEFSRAEQVVMLRALRKLYSNPAPGMEAPILPMFLNVFNTLELEEDRHIQARDELAESLHDFLEGIGESFKKESQFVISDVANAIDFDKFTGELADFFMSFICIRLAANAFSRGARNQIVLNEYKVLLERSPQAIRWITLSIDRMGRKDWVGLTRISQGFSEIQSVDSEVISSLENITLLARKDQWHEIGQELQMPGSSIQFWENFKFPKPNERQDYREAFVQEKNEWYHLYLKFPEIGLKLMNTDPEYKELRQKVYAEASDAYDRIHLFDKLKAQQLAKEQAENEKYENMALV